MSNMTPVLIVGAGPTGLSMAVGLHRHGIPFRIIDKQVKPVTTSNAIVIQTRTLEVWDDMGFLSRAVARGNIIKQFSLYVKNKKLASIAFELLATTHPFVLGLAQSQTEHMLHEYLKQNNIPVEIEVELTDFTEQINSMRATLRHKGGEVETLKADWLIACDGAHSLIREKTHLAFQGREFEQHFVLADFPLDSGIAEHDICLFLADKGPLIIARYNQDHARVIAEVTHDSELSAAKSVTTEQLNRLLADRCPFPVKIKGATWASGFWIHEKLIAAYRHKRIFFLGDAAHIHSPAGGQGMNTGIQDAYNLAWKLALVIQKRARPSLLESYQDERYGVAETLLRNTTGLTRLITLRNPLLKKIRHLLMSLLTKSDRFRKKIAMTLTQLAVHYPTSPLTQDCLKHRSTTAAGMRMLDGRLDQGRLFDYVRGIEHCLLIFHGTQPLPAPILLNLKNRLQQTYPQLIKLVLITPKEKLAGWDEAIVFDKNLALHQLYQVAEPSLYLIRPDKYIGFRGALMHQDELMTYLNKIFLV